MNNIADAIRRMAQGGRQTVSLICTVDAVDKEARTVDCSPLDESAPLLGVNLQANQGSKFGVVIYPRVGSYVVVGFMSDGAAGIVQMTDDIESIEIVVSDKTSRVLIDDERVRIDVDQETSAELSKDGIVLNGGSLRGLVKIAELEDNLNQLKTYVETLKSATSSGINAVGVSTAANGPAGAATFDGAMASANISFKNMENEKVKQ